MTTNMEAQVEGDMGDKDFSPHAPPQNHSRTLTYRCCRSDSQSQLAGGRNAKTITSLSLVCQTESATTGWRLRYTRRRLATDQLDSDVRTVTRFTLSASVQRGVVIQRKARKKVHTT